MSRIANVIVIAHFGFTALSSSSFLVIDYLITTGNGLLDFASMDLTDYCHGMWVVVALLSFKADKRMLTGSRFWLTSFIYMSSYTGMEWAIVYPYEIKLSRNGST